VGPYDALPARYTLPFLCQVKPMRPRCLIWFPTVVSSAQVGAFAPSGCRQVGDSSMNPHSYAIAAFAPSLRHLPQRGVRPWGAGRLPGMALRAALRPWPRRRALPRTSARGSPPRGRQRGACSCAPFHPPSAERGRRGGGRDTPPPSLWARIGEISMATGCRTC
jgi:hypothetical protein